MAVSPIIREAIIIARRPGAVAPELADVSRQMQRVAGQHNVPIGWMPMGGHEPFKNAAKSDLSLPLPDHLYRAVFNETLVGGFHFQPPGADLPAKITISGRDSQAVTDATRALRTLAADMGLESQSIRAIEGPFLM